MVASADLETLDATGLEAWRGWLRKNHLDKPGVWPVFHKGGKPPITYDEALDEALAYGWIDSVLRRVDDERYVRKFTPRRPRSVWSAPNIDRVKRLSREGRMTKWGLAVFGKHAPK